MLIAAKGIFHWK